MSGNATYRHTNTAVLSICAVEAPVVVTSDELDERLMATYERLGLQSGMLERLAGIHERRWWPEDVSFADGAAMAGAKALAEAGVDPSHVGLMINTSVSREHLEPSTAVGIHHRSGLPTVVPELRPRQRVPRLRQRHAARRHDDRLRADRLRPGRRRRGRSQHVQEITLDRLSGPTATADDVLREFATLTLGSGAAAMVLGRADLHPRGPPRRSAASPAPPPSTTTCASATSS